MNNTESITAIVIRVESQKIAAFTGSLNAAGADWRFAVPPSGEHAVILVRGTDSALMQQRIAAAFPSAVPSGPNTPISPDTLAAHLDDLRAWLSSPPAPGTQP